MKLVIIGNGVAGVTTARFVAERDSSAEVVLYSEEPYLYYPRPRLIDLVAGQMTLEELPQYPESWYQDRGIHMALGQRIAEIRPSSHEIVGVDGRIETYDQLVLATGASAFVPPIPGADLPGVLTLRTMSDALDLLDRLRTAKNVVVLGGGLLGLDTSMAMQVHGVKIFVVELLPWLLPRQLDAEGASVLEGILEQQGLEIITGDLGTLIAGKEQVRHVHLKSGRVLDADIVVVSAGVRSNIALAKKAGLACHNGVIVNDHLLTSDPYIYAVGDVAEFNERVWGIIPAALTQARVAAAQVLGNKNLRYEDIVPSTTLQVTGIDLTSIGDVHPKGEGFIEVRHSDPRAGVYKKLVIRDGRVVGAIILGDRKDVRVVNQLISQGVEVSEHVDELLSSDFDLSSLLRVSASRQTVG